MTWTMPSYEEQEKHLAEIGAVVGKPTIGYRQVRFRSSEFVWNVTHFSVLSPTDGPPRSINVHLQSPTTGRQRTAWPWELRGVG